MTGALAWLNDLIQWFGRWIPRLLLIHPTHMGVRFGPTGRAVAVGPGLILYWPMTHDVVQIPVTTQSIQLCALILPLDDDKPILPRVAVCTLNLQFAISDPVTAATSVLHFQALIANRAQALSALHWLLAKSRSDLDWLREAEDALRSEMATYGIHLLSLEIAGMGTGCVLKNISDWTWQDDGTRRTT